ncbi:MAG: exopolyphosphatase [Bacteroidales bacterium]|nr:exopolyphosphatase [Bacteroidales bacterium]
MNCAVIDLGTNTFNLLIANAVNGRMNEIIREKRTVKIGKGGLNNNIIASDAYKRAIEAIKEYANLIQQYHVHRTKIIATSAFRTTENGPQLASEIENIIHSTVEIIDGNKEAEYIYYGIREAVPLTDKKVLMLDIGGGSNELIIANKEKIFWKESYKLGISRLIEHFHPNDPMTPQEIEQIALFIRNELATLKTALESYPTNTLVGSSGSFDTISNILHFKQVGKPLDLSQTWNALNIMQFGRLLDLLIISSSEQRKDIQGMDMSRLEMIPIAALFIRIVLEFFKCQYVFHSAYAIKEGVWFQTFLK